MDPISLLNTILYAVLPFLFVLSVVVVIHELGHYWAARLCGVRIDAFSLGFGKELFHWIDRHGTRWRVAALPLGGYVRFWGDADATTSRADDAALANATAAERAGSFHHKPLYQKAIIAAAGPLANFILALVIFAGVKMFMGERLVPPQIGVVTAGSPAEKAGLRPGDRIVAVNGEAIQTFVEFERFESLSTGLTMTLDLERPSERFTAQITPVLVERDDGQNGKIQVPEIGVDSYEPPYISAVHAGTPAQKASVQVGDLILKVNGVVTPKFRDVITEIMKSKGAEVTLNLARQRDIIELKLTPEPKPGLNGKTVYQVGIGYDATKSFGDYKVAVIYYDPLTAVSRAAADVGFIIAKISEFFVQLFTGSADYRQLSGPIGIAKVSSDVAQVSLAGLIQLIAVLSVSIGLLNLLPIPILDGGHLLYYAIEGVRGQPLGEKAQEFGFRIGLAFVLGLMLVATWNDIVKVSAGLF